MPISWLASLWAKQLSLQLSNGIKVGKWLVVDYLGAQVDPMGKCLPFTVEAHVASTKESLMVGPTAAGG